MLAAGHTDLCLALPGTIMQTGNYHFNASSIGAAVVYRGGTPKTDTGRKTASGGEKREKHDGNKTTKAPFG